MITNKNILNKNRYLISDELEEYLAKYYDTKSINDLGFIPVKKDLGVYLVVFRVLNNEKNNILYNYVYYPPLFWGSLIYYLAHRGEHNNALFRELGNYFVIIDNNLYSSKDA